MGERRFIAAFAESTVAWFLHFGWMILAVGGAALSGQKIAYKLQYRAKTLGIVLGIAVGLCLFFAIAKGLMFVFSQIPGVGWRIERQMSSGE